MKVVFFLLLVLFSFRAVLAQDPPTSYQVPNGNGNGYKFWNSDEYKIHMGNSSEYAYGPVTGYSIKTNMYNAGGWGWTWGTLGQTPVAALTTQGQMQVAGDFSAGNLSLGSPASVRKVYSSLSSLGAIELPRGEILFSNTHASNQLYLSSNTYFNGDFYLRNSAPAAVIGLDAGNIYLQTAPTGTAGTLGVFSTGLMVANSGNVGIGTAYPANKLTIVGASSVEENVLNVSNYVDQDFVVKLSGAGSSVKRTVIGPATLNRFSLAVGANSNEHLTIVNGGNVGIGTTSPLQKLDVSGSIKITGPLSGWHGELSFYRGDGVKFASIGQANLTINNSTFDIQHFNGNDIRFLNNTVEQLRINGTTGNVGIGTANPDQKLTVNGTIHAKEVKVDLSVPGPDYVFTDSYDLLSLDKVETYIDQNKHLPEVPSAAEMEKNGINVSEMNMLLLKKVEELTLYVIELKKEIDTIKNR